MGCLNRAFDGAEATLATVLAAARFWESHSGEAFNERQRMMLRGCMIRSKAPVLFKTALHEGGHLGMRLRLRREASRLEICHI